MKTKEQPCKYMELLCLYYDLLDILYDIEDGKSRDWYAGYKASLNKVRKVIRNKIDSLEEE